MARLIVMHDTDPDLAFELMEVGDEGEWDGTCSECGYNLMDVGCRGELRDAIETAGIHLDHQH